jgi:hypothetical protein
MPQSPNEVLASAPIEAESEDELFGHPEGEENFDMEDELA